MPYARKKVHMVLQFLCAIKFSIYKGIGVFTYFLVQFHLYFKSLIFIFFFSIGSYVEAFGASKIEMYRHGQFSNACYIL